MNELCIYVLAHSVFLIAVSYYWRKEKRSESFLIAERKRSWWQILSSKYASSIGISWFISYTAYMYEFGLSVLSMIAGMIVSYIIFALWVVSKIHKESKEKNFLTHGDYIQSKTGSSINKKVIDIFSIVITFIWLLTSFIGGAKVISSLNLLSYENSLFLTGGIILIYLLFSGFRAVIITDIFQTIIILILLAVSIFSVFGNGQGTETLEIVKKAEVEFVSTGLLVGFLVYGLFSMFSNADRFQLVFASKTVKDAKKGMLLSVLPIVVTAGFLMIIALIMKGSYPDIEPDLAFVQFIFEYLPETFLSFGFLLIFAGLMSSAGTNIFNISSYAMSIMKTKDNQSKENEMKSMIKKQKLIMILVVIISIILGLVFRDIVNVTIFAAGFTLTTSVAIIYVLAGGRSSSKFNLSIFMGLVGLVIGIVIFGVTPTIALFPIIFSGLGLLTPQKLINIFNFKK